jgi:anti-sigma factor RsiW
MKSTCSKTRQRLERYFDGELSRRQKDRVEDHLAACAPCERHLEALRRTAGAVQSTMRARTADVDFDAVWSGIAPRLDGPKPSIWERWNVSIREFFAAYKPVLAMAGAAAVIAALVAVPLLLRDDPTRPSQGPELAKVQSNECIIESIEASGSTPMVQELQNQTKVIWMIEEPEDDSTGPSGL